MLKNIKRIVMLAGAIVLCASCTDYLTSAPVGSLSPDGFYNSVAHVEQGVLGVYSKIRGIEDNQYMIFSNDRSDDKFVNPTINGVRTCSEVAFLRINSTVGEASSLWSGWYSLIYNANSVLMNMEGVEFKEESLKNQYKGELYFLRGWAHMELARTFGNVPIVDHVLSVNEAKELKQSTPAEVMAAAIADLKLAESLLPEESGMKDSGGAKIGGEGRADKIVAEAMLARAYMTLKGFPFNDASAKAEAKTYLEKVLNYSKSNGDKYWAPTFKEWGKQYMTDPSTANKYQIFSIQHTKTAGTPFSTDSGTELHGADDEGREYLPYGKGGSLMSEAWLDVSMYYEYSRTGDKRGEGFAYLNGYKAFGSTTSDYVNPKITFKYNGETITDYSQSIITKWIPYPKKREAFEVVWDDVADGTAWPVNFPILRLEDMQLYYAELLVEDNKIADAMGYVNKIRTRAGIETVPTDCSAADALGYVKRERRLELFMEGVRWFDEIRYGEWKDLTLAKYSRHDVNGKPGLGIAPENVIDGRHFIPIPFSQMSAVPGLYTQNEGWH